MNSSALGSRSLSRNGEGSMALNNCFNSPRCTSMTEHLGGSGSPAEGWSGVPERLVIGLGYAMRQGGCELFPDDWSGAGSQKFDRPEHLMVRERGDTHLECNSRKASENFVHVEYLLRDRFSIAYQQRACGPSQSVKWRPSRRWPATFFADFLYRRSQLRLTSARDEGIGAFVNKRFCRSETNPASPTSNECDFSFKLAYVLH